MNLAVRLSVWEHGFLPLQALCPQLDSQACLLQAHTKLLERSCQAPPYGHWVITPQDLASVLELTNTQLEVLCEVLSALSVLNGQPPDRAAAGSEQLYVHEVSLFLFVLLFSKEAQRQADNNLEVWPEAGGPASFGNSFSTGLDGLLSPTRAMSVRTSLNGKASVRQQLQQHLKHQTQQLRGLNDYIRRNLRTLVDLCLDLNGPMTTPLSSSSTPAGVTPASSMLPDTPLTEQQQQQQPQQGLQLQGSTGPQRSLSGPLPGMIGMAGLSVLATQPSLGSGLSFTSTIGGGGGPQRLVSAQEVDRLRFVLQAAPFRTGVSISSLMPGFAGPNNPLLPMDQVVASLRQLWHEEVLQSPRVGACSPAAAGLLASPMSSSGKASRHLGLVGFTGQVDDSSINGVYKGTVVRGESDVPHSTLRVTDCHDTVIYALAPLQSVYISSCSECIIIIGAAGGLVRLERCEKVTLIALAARVVISNCHDCTLHLGTPRQPMLIGDCRFVRLAPYNTRYERQLAHVRACGLRLDAPNRWDNPLVLVAKDRRTATSANGAPDSPRAGVSASTQVRSLQSTTFSLLQPEELLPFVIPFQGGSGMLAGGPAPSNTTAWRSFARNTLQPSSSEGGGSTSWSSPGAWSSPNSHTPGGASSPGPSGSPAGAGGIYLFPLPPEYERALHRKLAMTSDLRHKFRQAGLTKEREQDLNNTIQAYFKDWLSSSSMLRQIYDLSNLEKEEGASGGGVLGPAGGSLGLGMVPDLSMPPPTLRDKVALNL